MATLDLTELRVYQLAMRVGKDVWSTVSEWAWFEKQTLGLQWVRAADSIAANISEGYGRYSYRENARFCYYARGSLRETGTWLSKSAERNLIGAAEVEELNMKLDTLRRQLDNYIHSLGHNPGNVLREDSLGESFPEQELPPMEEFLSRIAPLTVDPLTP